MRPSRQRAATVSFLQATRAPGVHLTSRSGQGNTRKPPPRRTRRSTATRTVKNAAPAGTIQKIKLAIQEGVKTGVKTLRGTSFSLLFLALVLVAVICFTVNAQMRIRRLERLFRQMQ